MKQFFRSLFLPTQRISRRAYLWTGTSLFAVKYAVDYTLARLGLGIEWWPTDYFWPRHSLSFFDAENPPRQHLFLLLVALPFIWIGVNLTNSRLKTLRWPKMMVLLFFTPIVNLLFFAALSFVPEPIETAPDHLHQTTPSVRAALSHRSFVVALVTFFSLCIVCIATVALNSYGWGLFIGVPFFTGFLPAFLYARGTRPSFRSCFQLTIYSQLFISLALFAALAEGIICILMAAPLSLAVGFFGALIGYGSRELISPDPKVACASFLVLPFLLATETKWRGEPSLFEVKSSVEINAPPSRVWNSVVTFSELPAPTELIFRAGIAYPIRAEIQGRGPGAIRHCVFSTGPFVEPIEVWNEPKLLRFSVTSNPPPMQELSFAEVDPPHLHGFLQSEHGQFELLPLPNNRTRLVGTTWYRHSLWPETYWKIWSDYIIHTIHLRVLKHIKTNAESI